MWYNTGMKILKKILLTILVVVGAIIAVVFLINLIDEKLNPLMYTEKDLSPASSDKSNGFYILWGLAEPEEIDPQSDEYARSIQDKLNNKYIDTFEKGFFDSKAYRSLFNDYSAAIDKIKIPQLFSDKWISSLISQAQTLDQVAQACALPLKRYNRLIDTPVFEDFTPPKINSPIPNIIAWLKILRLFSVIETLDALHGNWEKAANRLLDNIDFSEKVGKGSRMWIIFHLSNNTALWSLSALMNIMNHPDCPPSIHNLVFNRLSSIKPRKNVLKNILISECLSSCSVLDNFETYKNIEDQSIFFRILPQDFLLQTNATKNYFYDSFSKFMSMESLQPFQWKTTNADELASKMPNKKFLWWIQNPVGKTIYMMTMPHFHSPATSYYRTRAYLSLTRIIAELHLKDTGQGEILPILQTLDSYKAIDPFSGKPFLWNNSTQRLYSIGQNFKDEKGAGDINQVGDDLSEIYKRKN